MTAETSELESPGARNPVQGATLYVVATPIGNLGDLSPRAAAVLGHVDRIAAEDTRTTGVMLSQLGIRPPTRGMTALHEHNEERIADSLIRELQAGASIALVSDAGTPLISDPGFSLVRAARAAGITVIAVPGPCAAMAALSISGLPTDRFMFAGFLPSRSGARRAVFQTLLDEPRTAILYESSHRIADSLIDLVAVLGETRRVCLARELTKRFEDSVTLPAGELLAWQAADANRGRGEFVLIVEGAAQREDSAEAERVLRLLLRELSPSAAARLAAEITGAARKPLYALAMKLSGDGSDDAEASTP
jgi:16S rRNA (cytidine1402-2'-O)-methyltransferase